MVDDQSILSLLRSLESSPDLWTEKDLEPLVESFETRARDAGLGPGEIAAFVRLLTRPPPLPPASGSSKEDGPRALPEKATVRLLRACFPKAQVPVEAVIVLVSALPSLARASHQTKWLPKVGRKSLGGKRERPSASPQEVAQLVARGPVSHDLQLAALRWICLVFDRIDDLEQVHKLYHVFFQFTEYETLRAPVFQLLYKLTRRNDVLSYRVRHLLQLQGRFPLDPHVYSLLHLYHRYDPRIPFPLRRPPGMHKVSPLRSMDKDFSSRLFSMAAAAASPRAAPGLWISPSSSSFLSLALPAQLRQQPFPRLSASGVGDGHDLLSAEAATAAVCLDMSREDRNSVSLEQISSLETLVLNFERTSVLHAAGLDNGQTGQTEIDLLCRELESPLFRQYLRLTRDPVVLHRLCTWVDFSLEEVFFQTDCSVHLPEQQRQVLRLAASICDTFQEMPREVYDFIVRFLGQWEMDADPTIRDLMCRLLRYIRPCPYEDLYSEILQLVHRKIIDVSLETRLAVLEALLDMLDYWLLWDWPLLSSHSLSAAMAPTSAASAASAAGLAGSAATAGGMSVGTDSGPSKSGTLLPPSPLGSAGPSIFGSLKTGVDYLRSLYELVKFLDRLVSVCLVHDGDHPLAMQAALDLATKVSQFQTVHKLPFVFRPSLTIVYHALLAFDGYACSRICASVAKYRAEFDLLLKSKKQQQQPRLSFPVGLEEMDVYNRFIRDFSYCLWRRNAFGSGAASKSESTFIFAMPHSVVEKMGSPEELQPSLSLVELPSLKAVARQFLQTANAEREAQHEGSDGFGSRAVAPLRGVEEILDDKQARVAYVQYLQELGFGGFRDFLYTYIPGEQH